MLLVKLNMLAIMLQGEVGFDLRSMWAQMGFAAKAVVILLAVMSAAQMQPVRFGKPR